MNGLLWASPGGRVDVGLGACRESLQAVEVAFVAGRLVETLECVADLRQDVDAVEAAAVARARQYGRTWAEIGAALGVTKQAVWVKYGRPAM